MDEYTQLEDEEIEAYRIRKAEEREAEKEKELKRWEKIRSFRWNGGMP